MDKSKELKSLIESWKLENISFLPLNIDEWNINLNSEPPIFKTEQLLEFGRYNSTLVGSTPFYKAFSRLISLNHDEKVPVTL